MLSYASVTTLYVSGKTGNSRNSGVNPVNDHMNNGPFLWLEDAFRIIREMRGAGFRQPVTVKLLDDITYIEHPIEISAPYGEPYHDPQIVFDVTVEPYGQGKKLISAGKRIEGFKEDTFNGVKCFSAFIPEVKEGKWKFTDLYVDKERASMTRYPETGYLQPEDVETHDRSLGAGSSWFIAKEGDIKDFYNVEDAIISFGHYWVDEHSPIKSYDKATRKVVMENKTTFTVYAPEGKGSAVMDYWLDNVAEMFKNPGEWYLDRPNGMLYYIPKYPTQTPENIEVYAPVTDKIFDVKGNIEKGKKIKGFRLRNLELAYTRGEYTRKVTKKDANGNDVVTTFASDGQSCCGLHGAINFLGCSDCTVDNVDIYCSGTNGVVVQAGCDHIEVKNCTVRNGGGGGVRIHGGEEGEFITHDITVADCTLENLGNRYFASDGVLIMDARDCNITHNEIHGLYYSGVCVGWVWGYTPSVTCRNKITKNHIWDLGRGRLSDMGGVYLLGGQPGTVVSGNIIHDIKSKCYGGWALYTDEGSSFITLENNICYNVSENCYHQHYGSMNTVRNNIFAYANEEAVRMTRHEGHVGLLLENNIILCKEGHPVYGNSLATGLSTDRNLIWDESGKAPVFIQYDDKTGDFKEAKDYFGWDNNSEVKNPRFKDPKHFDFTLRKDSPAFKLGFKPIDTSDVGPRK